MYITTRIKETVMKNKTIVKIKRANGFMIMAVMVVMYVAVQVVAFVQA